MRVTLLLPAAILTLLGVLGGAGPGSSQSVSGTALDRDTGAPIAGVELTLRNQGGDSVAQTRTRDDGRFFLAAREVGVHYLSAVRLGYQALEERRLELDREIVDVELRLSTAPLEIDPLVVVGRRHDARHDRSYEGFLIRRDQLPNVGPRRAIHRSDPEFRGAMRTSDVLRSVPVGGPEVCMIIYRDGDLTRDTTAVDDLLDSSSENWEGLEFYRWWGDAPAELKGAPPAVYDPTRCSVLALWFRQDPYRPEAPLWRRVLTGAGFLAAVSALAVWLL